MVFGAEQLNAVPFELVVTVMVRTEGLETEIDVVFALIWSFADVDTEVAGLVQDDTVIV